MKFFHPILILATAYLIRHSGLVKIDKCGLDSRKFNMTLDNGRAVVFFLTGNNGTCIAGVKDELSFEKAKGSCEKLFSGGTMMSDENFDGQKSNIIGTGFEFIRAYMISGTDCWYINNEYGTLTKKDCPSTTAKYNYFCQYPMQYNCAWQTEYIEMVTQSEKKFVMNHTVFSYDNEIGSKKGCPLIMDGSLQCSQVGMFPGGPTEWSSCSESCTDPTNPAPTQSMIRKVNTGCFETTKDAKEVFLHTKRSCNGHVLCPPTATVKPSSPDKPLSTDKDSLQPDSSSMWPIIFGSIGGFLFVVLVAVVFVCCYRWRRKRDNLPSGDGSSKRRSKRRSSVSSQAPEQSKKRRSRSPSPSTGQKSDVGGKRESPIRGRKGDTASRHESPIRGGRKGDAASGNPIRGGRKGDVASGSPIRGGRKGDAASGSPIRGGRKGDAASAHGSVASVDSNAHGSVASVDSNIITESGVYKRYGRELIQNRVSAGAASTPKQDLSLPAKVDSV